MEPTYLTDYLRLAFRLGHISASMGSVFQAEPEVVEEWQDDIDAISERMDYLGLPQSKMLIVSFLEQVGDLTQSDVFDEMTNEVNSNLQDTEDRIRREEQELRDNPGVLPGGVRELLGPLLLDALPQRAREEYEEAQKNLLAGTWTSAVRCACVAVEKSFRALYTLETGLQSSDKLLPDLERELGQKDKINGRHPLYIIGRFRDIQKNYRNPIMHGEERIETDDDAFAHFYDCTVVLRRIAGAILTKSMPKS